MISMLPTLSGEVTNFIPVRDSESIYGGVSSLCGRPLLFIIVDIIVRRKMADLKKPTYRVTKIKGEVYLTDY